VGVRTVGERTRLSRKRVFARLGRRASGHRIWHVTAREDIAVVAGQLATLTQSVEEMAGQLKELRERSEGERERMDIQQERIDLAARELTDVSERLQAAANALRESI
jgi:adenylosuccinate lyase